MNFKKLLRKNKAISSVLGAVLLIGLTMTTAGIIYAALDSTMSFNSKIQSAGAITAADVNNDGLIDKMTIPLVNTGMDNAQIQSVQVIQGDNTLLWYTFDDNVKMSEIESINIYALGELQQVEPTELFSIQVIFDEGEYSSPGYIALNANQIPSEIIPTIPPGDGSGDDDSEDPETIQGYNYLIVRTEDDDEYAKRKFPTETGFSPNLWFLLGEFDDDNKRPDLDTDFINLCGHGNEEDYMPYLLDDSLFTEGNIGTQTNNMITAYNDSGEHTGLISFNKYGKWDKEDNLNYGKYGIVYMWSYIYNDGADPLTVNIGANGASEYNLWLNGKYLLSGNKKNKWYVSEGVTLNPGLNLIMMKISAKTNAHFAGQVLLYNSAITSQLASLYSVWPSYGDL